MSNYGPSVDIAAPGSEIFSTGSSIPNSIMNYVSASGTSLAAPHVTGVVALMIELFPQITVSEIKFILLNSTDLLPSLQNKIKSSGRINASKALNQTVQLRLKKGFDCPLPENKRILDESEDSLTIEWTLNNDGRLWVAHKPLEKNYKDYLNWVFTHTSMTSIDSLKKYSLVTGRAIEQETDDSNYKISLQKSYEMVQKIINGKIGKLHRLSCVESIPFREYIRLPQRYLFFSEFYTLILKRDYEIKIISQFINPKQISFSGSGPNKTFNDELSFLLENNWKVTHALHNHPYYFDNPNGDFGGNLGPSEPDIIHSFKESFPEVLITNGIDSISLKQPEVKELYNFIKDETKNSTE